MTFRLELQAHRGTASQLDLFHRIFHLGFFVRLFCQPANISFLFFSFLFFSSFGLQFVSLRTSFYLFRSSVFLSFDY